MYAERCSISGEKQDAQLNCMLRLVFRTFQLEELFFLA